MEEDPDVVGVGRGRRVGIIAVSVVVVAALAGVAFALGRHGRDDRIDAERTADRADATSTSTTSTPASTAAPSSTAPSTAAPPSTTVPTTAAPTTAAPVTTDAAPTYVFPIQPASAADYPSSHHDYPAADIFAPCGTTIVAPTSGTIQEVTLEDRWSSSNDDPALRGGLSFALVGDDGVRYYGSHLARFEVGVQPGARLRAGDPLGAVGRTGNAAGTPCHLHFGISTPCGPGDVLRRRGEFWPQPYLDSWKVGAGSSPADRPDPAGC